VIGTAVSAGSGARYSRRVMNRTPFRISTWVVYMK
jgi:hypothetical protein